MAPNLKRWLRHLVAARGKLERAFPVQTLAAIEQAISAAERLHRGEIRFAIEGSLDPGDAWRGRSPRERALELFAALGVWDTEANNGVLIYVLLADRDVEIVADRGYNDRVGTAEWSAVCATMEQEFRAGHYEHGAVAGVQEAGRLMTRHFPALPGGRDEDELPNWPALL